MLIDQHTGTLRSALRQWSKHPEVRTRKGYDGLLFELTAKNARDYLRRFHGLDADSSRVEELGGGVSNTVVLVENGDQRLVLKQSLGKLRVEQDWYADRARVLREADAIERLSAELPSGSLPTVLFQDRENFAFAMTAAPPGARTWKSLLLEGEVSPTVAQTIARMLAAIIRASRQHPEWQIRFGDQTVFDELRLDPYYRATAARHPGLRSFFEDLIAECSGRRESLVHGDWSPKNFLVAADATVMAIDFEVIHYGNPAFDAAFFLNHLLLKSFFKPAWAGLYRVAAEQFWSVLAAEVAPGMNWLEASSIRQLAGLLLARIDGKSPAEYIRGETMKEAIRGFAKQLIHEPPGSVAEVFGRLR